MKLIIAGTRTLFDPAVVRDAMDAFVRQHGQPTEIVSGGAAGADALGEKWAVANGLPVKRFDADWAKHGRAAGPIRNRAMSEYADALLACWDGTSKGTADMGAKMRKLKKLVEVWRY